VWIFDRDGGDPQLVYTEEAADDAGSPNPPVFRTLAWSPDGHTLTFVSTGQNFSDSVDAGVWPRLVALRFTPGDQVQPETLRVYDDYDWRRNEGRTELQLFFDLHFAYGWSPDGTRIAVTSEGGVAEISPEDGLTLDRHPGKKIHGPLAWLREAPTESTSEETPAVAPMQNGRIIKTGDDTNMPEWDEFDQDTASFLYLSGYPSDYPLVSVVREGKRVAEFDCPSSAACDSIGTFGPGPDELTVPAASQPDDVQAVQVIGFDGTVRDTLDISPTITEDQQLSDLAWSPDGTHLAISTETSCDDVTVVCEGKVWEFDQDGEGPQLIYTHPSVGVPLGEVGYPPTLHELAWSPDGRALSLLVTPLSLKDASKDEVQPSLKLLWFSPNRTISTGVWHRYEDVDLTPDLVEQNYRSYFASAWSPDGTRVAVTNRNGVVEISAEDGRVLARHPYEDPRGLLAWLPKP
jgi:dipeptidyl aminopeptidase/acylaminoacyl peptidase